VEQLRGTPAKLLRIWSRYQKAEYYVCNLRVVCSPNRGIVLTIRNSKHLSTRYDNQNKADKRKQCSRLLPKQALISGDTVNCPLQLSSISSPISTTPTTAEEPKYYYSLVIPWSTLSRLVLHCSTSFFALFVFHIAYDHQPTASYIS
jgi:hypothetical protein